MWNKRSQEELPPVAKPAMPAPAHTDVIKKETTPVSSMPVRTPEPDTGRGSASIGKAVKINGQIISKEDLYVDGDLEGTIELQEHRLTIGPNGKVQAGIRAREVVVLGSIQGNVDASDKIEIRKDAKLVGDIKTARIIIEDGAYFKGSIDIVKSEPAKASAVAARPPVPPAAAAANSPINTAPAEVKR